MQMNMDAMKSEGGREEGSESGEEIKTHHA